MSMPFAGTFAVVMNLILRALISASLSHDGRMQGELAIKNVQLAAATKEAEKLLKEISENTAVAEKEKNKVAVIVDGVTKQAAVSC